MSDNQRGPNYYLRSADISSPRFTTEEGPIDISKIILEINLYENLMVPYITGDILIADTEGLSNIIKASGQETIRLELYVSQDAPLVREFVIYSIKKQTKNINTSSSIYSFSIIEKHGFYSFFERINKSFTGNISDIIYNVYYSTLFGLSETDPNVDIEQSLLKPENFEPTSQYIKVISPNKTPLAFCMWLAQRATTDIGEPFFLYSSLREGPQFRSLFSLINQAVEPNTPPYRLSQVFTEANFVDEIYRIVDINIPENDNNIALAKAGAFGMIYQSIDPFFKSNDRTIYQAKFNQNDYFNEKKSKGRTLADFNLYDDKFRIGPGISVQEDGSVLRGKSMAELNSQIQSQINTSFSFENFSSYDEEPNINRHLLKVKRNSDMAFINKQKLNVIIPGYNMLKSKTNTSIGKIIDVRIPSDRVHTQNPDDDELYETKKTAGNNGGLFLTTAVRHRFGLDQNYMASLELAKLSSNEEL